MGVDFTLRPARADTGNGMEWSRVRLSEETLLSPP